MLLAAPLSPILIYILQHHSGGRKWFSGVLIEEVYLCPFNSALHKGLPVVAYNNGGRLYSG